METKGRYAVLLSAASDFGNYIDDYTASRANPGLALLLLGRFFRALQASLSIFGFGLVRAALTVRDLDQFGAGVGFTRITSCR